VYFKKRSFDEQNYGSELIDPGFGRICVSYDEKTIL
jgi:hypothetical protein